MQEIMIDCLDQNEDVGVKFLNEKKSEGAAAFCPTDSYRDNRMVGSIGVKLVVGLEAIKTDYHEYLEDLKEYGEEPDESTTRRLLDALLAADYPSVESIIRFSRVEFWERSLRCEAKKLLDLAREVPLLKTITDPLRQTSVELSDECDAMLTRLDKGDVSIFPDCRHLLGRIRETEKEIRYLRTTAAQDTVRSVAWKGLPITLASIIIIFWFTGANALVPVVCMLVWLFGVAFSYYAVKEYPSIRMTTRRWVMVSLMPLSYVIMVLSAYYTLGTVSFVALLEMLSLSLGIAGLVLAIGSAISSNNDRTSQAE